MKRDSCLAQYAGVVLQQFEFIKVNCMGKIGIQHYSQNFDIYAIKVTYVHQCLVVYSIVLTLLGTIRSLLSELSLFSFPLRRKNKGYHTWFWKHAQFLCRWSPRKLGYDTAIKAATRRVYKCEIFLDKISLGNHGAKYVTCFKLCASFPWSGVNLLAWHSARASNVSLAGPDSIITRSRRLVFFQFRAFYHAL